MDASALELDAVKFAQLAVQRDQSGRYQEAVFYYRVWGGGGSAGGRWGPSPGALKWVSAVLGCLRAPEGWKRS